MVQNVTFWKVAGVKGIEPLVAVLETAVFPLHYTPIIGVDAWNQTRINGFAIRRIIILPRQHKKALIKRANSNLIFYYYNYIKLLGCDVLKHQEGNVSSVKIVEFFVLTLEPTAFKTRELLVLTFEFLFFIILLYIIFSALSTF